MLRFRRLTARVAASRRLSQPFVVDPRAIVSGANAGIGYAAALQLAQRQLTVRPFVAAVPARFEHLDVLINNAGNFDLSQESPVTEDGFETIWATNYLGPWLLTHLLLPLLKARNPSRIINVGSKGLALDNPSKTLKQNKRRRWAYLQGDTLALGTSAYSDKTKPGCPP